MPEYSPRKSNRTDASQLKTPRDLDSIYRAELKRAGLQSAFEAVASIASQLDKSTYDYFIVWYDTQISLIDRPYLLEYLIPAIAALIGALAVISSSATSAVMSALSPLGSFPPEGVASAATSMLKLVRGSVIQTASTSLALFLGTVLPISIHKLILHNRLQRYLTQRGALRQALQGDRPRRSRQRRPRNSKVRQFATSQDKQNHRSRKSTEAPSDAR